jgi:hypothetical protein
MLRGFGGHTTTGMHWAEMHQEMVFFLRRE